MMAIEVCSKCLWVLQLPVLCNHNTAFLPRDDQTPTPTLVTDPGYDEFGCDPKIFFLSFMYPPAFNHKKVCKILYLILSPLILFFKHV